jgi:hypothetical protein
MNWKAPLAIIILLSSTSVPATIAVNPTDNDAGSDRDAGDREELALPIETGTHEATLAPPYDRIDWFTFEAEEGQRLEFGIETWDNVTFVELYGPGGDPHFDLPPGNVSHVVSETGSWTVQFRHSNSDPWPANYRFSIELHEPQQRIVDHVSAGGTVFEASWEGTLDLSLTVLGCVSRGPSLHAENAGHLLWANWTDRGFDRQWIGGGATDSPGTGTTIRSGDTIDTDVPAIEPIETDSPGCLGLHFSGDIDDGSIRTLLWATHESQRSALTFGANRSVDARTSHVDEVIQWSGETNEGFQMQAPGLNVAGERSTEEQLSSEFVGHFKTYGSGGWIDPPKDDRIPIEDGEDHVWLASPTPGDWGFGLEPSLAVGHAERIHLHGIDAPSLGLADPPSVIREPKPCSSVTCLLSFP